MYRSHKRAHDPIWIESNQIGRPTAPPCLLSNSHFDHQMFCLCFSRSVALRIFITHRFSFRFFFLFCFHSLADYTIDTHVYSTKVCMCTVYEYFWISFNWTEPNMRISKKRIGFYFSYSFQPIIYMLLFLCCGLKYINFMFTKRKKLNETKKQKKSTYETNGWGINRMNRKMMMEIVFNHHLFVGKITRSYRMRLKIA